MLLIALEWFYVYFFSFIPKSVTLGQIIGFSTTFDPVDNKPSGSREKVIKEK